MAKAAASAAFAAASLFYLDRSLGVSRDVSQYREETAFGARLPQYVNKLGPQSTHLYRILELADPAADALWFEGRSWSYSAMKEIVDTLALGLINLGVKNGDVIAVFMSNCPEMVFIIYALTKVGAIPALLNNTLRDETLLHCIRLPSASLILSTPDLSTLAASAAKSLSESVRTISLNLGSFNYSTDSESDVLPFPMPRGTSPATTVVVPPRTMTSPAALIYTSGTSGKPKACSIKNAHVCVVSATASADFDNPKTYLKSLRTYSCMPLFHGTTFFTGLCYSVGNSGCFCVARKFSARKFWKDCHDSRATRMLYVGELCRFLLATPDGSYDRKHNVLVAAGNGLSKDVWVAFQKRFGVSEIREYYRSTEGLVKFDNRHRAGKPGAGKVGFVGTLRKRILEKDQFIVKFDYDSEMPIRDKTTGFCVPVKRNEAGEGIARIKSMETYTNYHNNIAATEQKILRDVFEKGDAFQRSGDLLMMESNGWVKFVDRIGDTYRWNGENVSAGEVRGFISELDGVKDVIVAGRRLDKYEGQAGTAIVTLDTGISEEQTVAALYRDLTKKGVPKYAIPRLVLIRRELVDVGDTFKHAKMGLKNIAWGASTDEQATQYYLDLEKQVYVRLTSEAWDKIARGQAKL